MTDEERHKVAIVARRLGDALDAGLIDGERFSHDIERLSEVALLLWLIPREEQHTATIIPFAPRGDA